MPACLMAAELGHQPMHLLRCNQSVVHKAQLRTDGGTSPLMVARHNSNHQYYDGVGPVSEG